ncbi:uncharacterized protein LOC123520147 isoform X1 [Portunus trituberculatus]|uniref:uncharacterized protein LOC123520147 isoform X1 n=2 Tax=Portunus trituberculatus TaxID=210409 RepID=UPI001E1CB14B|nr:uncharacterized protein LOC123520147 isoform X1 [Portunus trituberculatus]
MAGVRLITSRSLQHLWILALQQRPLTSLTMMHLLKFLFCLTVACGAVSLTEAAVDCSGGDGFKCESCSTLALCSGGSVASTFPCQSGELCEEGSSGTGSCMLVSASRTQCQCSSYPSYVVDSYDPQNYLLCFSSTLQIPLSCAPGEEFDTVTSTCAAVPTTSTVTTTEVTTTTEPTVTCTEDGIFPLLPSCSGYYGCYTVGGSVVSTGIVSCSESTPVFNPDTLACEASISGPATPTCASDDIVTADTVECNAFYVCNSGATVGEKICCGEGQVFNPATVNCEADTGSVTCPTVNPCYTGEIEKKCLPPTC